MIDSAGTSLLHLVSFGLKTWIAFFVAGCCASLITNAVLRLFTSGVEAGAEGAGLVEKKDREEATTYIILIIEMYLCFEMNDLTLTFGAHSCKFSIKVSSSSIPLFYPFSK